MAYTRPQIEVSQAVTQPATPTVTPQRALVVGPHARLARYAVAGEREAARLGGFDPLARATYPWPALPAGGTVDLPYTALTAADARLRYFTLASGAVVDRTDGRPNRVRWAAGVFAPSDAAAASAGLAPRGVVAGDAVRLTGAGVALWTRVLATPGDPVPAAVGAPAADPLNPAASVAAAAVTQTAGPTNCLSATASAAAYAPHVSGRVTDRYVVQVTQGSAGGDLTTARLRVTSDGGDLADAVVPAAAGTPFAAGTRGLTLTLALGTGACATAAAAAGVAANDLLPGQTWAVAVTAGYTPATLTAGTAFTGPADVTYTLRVVRGGLLAGSGPRPLVAVGTAARGEAGGPVAVPAAAADVAVGAYGLTVQFAGAGLRLGDRFVVPATAAAAGACRTLELADSLPDGLGNGAAVGLELHLVRPAAAVPAARPGAGGALNWAAAAGGLTVEAGALVADPEWLADGAPAPLPLAAYAGTALYATHRVFLADAAGAAVAVTAADRTLTLPGPVDPDNPLVYGVQLALANGADVVLALAVPDPADPAGWAAAFEAAFARADAYNVAALSDDPAVWDLLQAHVAAASVPAQAQWRRGWLGTVSLADRPLVHGGTGLPGHAAATTTDGGAPRAVVLDDPQAAGTQFTLVRFNATADLLAAGVARGDAVRLTYGEDAAGRPTFAEYPVLAVRTATELVLAAGPAAGVGTPARAEVWRHLTPAAEARAQADLAAGLGDRRLTLVGPWEFDAGGAAVPARFAACALAGQASGVPPHQPLTRRPLAGLTPTARALARFSEGQLDVMAAGGQWLVVRTPAGVVRTRDAVTTGNTDQPADREEMVVRNYDQLSGQVRDALEPFLGVRNANARTLDLMRERLDQLAAGVAGADDPALGPQADDFAFALAIDPANPGVVRVDAAWTQPTTLRRIRVFLSLSL